jgi:hypothetical protein
MSCPTPTQVLKRRRRRRMRRRRRRRRRGALPCRCTRSSCSLYAVKAAEK